MLSNKVSYHKQIARQQSCHKRGGRGRPCKNSSHLVWSPRTIRLLFVITWGVSRRSQKLRKLRPRPLGIGRGW